MQYSSQERIVGQRVGIYSMKHMLEQEAWYTRYLAQDATRIVTFTLFPISEQVPMEEHRRLLERFVQGASVLAQLRHPHLLPVYEYGEYIESPYLVTPYMKYGSLADGLKQRGCCTPGEALEVVEQVAAALEYIHTRGIMHGNLRTRNILRSDEGAWLVAGTGLVELLHMAESPYTNLPYAHLLNSTNAFLVAPEYMAPELIQGHPIHIRSDIYAMGMVLFELLSGKLPFTGSNPLAIAMQHGQQPLPSLRALRPELPASIEAVVTRALARNPAQRFQRASELAAAFASACEGISRTDAIPANASAGSIPQGKVLASTSSSLPVIKPDVTTGRVASRKGGKHQLAPKGRGRRLGRRQVVTLFATGGVAVAGAAVAVQMNPRLLKNLLNINRKPLPSFPRAASTGQVRTYTFEGAPTMVEVAGQQVSTWAYNGVVPGPEIRLNEGDTLVVTVKNRLPQGTTIHWHGVPLVNAMDGVPDVTQKAIQSGQEFVYKFVAPSAGTYLYHSHAGLQLDRGLYGPLIIQSTKETMKYDHDFALVLDDWLDGLAGTPEDAMKRLIANGDRMAGMGNMGGMGGGNMSGMNGMKPPELPPDLVYPRYLINGKSSTQPLELQVSQGQKARIRLINASASTTYHVALQGHRLTVTHADGQPVVPVEVDALRIGMGERYDVLVTANNPGVWQLAAKVEGAANMVRAVMRYKGSLGPLPPVMYLPTELMGHYLNYSMLKAAPGTVVPPTGVEPDQVIPLQLSGGMGQYVWKINDQVFEKADHIRVMQNQLIRFQFTNKSMMAHPMHLHGHFFQVDNGTGQGPLKDTVMVDPMQTLTVNWISDNPGAWAFHCHNRYHEDTGMMRIVDVG